MLDMSKKIWLFLMLVFTGSVYAQPTQRFDSLKLEVNQILAQSASGVDSAGMVKLNLLTTNYLYLNLDSAESLNRKAFEFAETFGHRFGLIQAKLNKVNLTAFRGKFAEALDLGLQTQLEAEAHGHPILVGTAYNTVGFIYQYIKDEENAIRAFERAVKEFESIDDVTNAINAKNNLATIQYGLGNYEQALAYYEDTYAESAVMGNVFDIAVAANNLAWTHIKMGNANLSKRYLEQAEDLNKKMGVRELQVWVNQGWAEYYLHKGALSQALTFAKKALDDALATQSITKLSDCNETLSRIYEAQQNGLAALKHFKTHKQISDSLFNQDVKSKTQFMQAKYEFDKQTLALKNEQALRDAAYEQQVANQRIIISAVFIGFVGAMMFAWFINLSRKKLEKANQQISEQRDRLEELNTTKVKLFSIISHDLRGPIGNVWMILEELKRASAEKDYSLVETFIHGSVDAARTSYELLENLLKWSRSQLGTFQVMASPFKANEVISSSISVLNSAIKAKNIHVTVQEMAQSAILGDEDMIQTVVRNVVSNAIKFTPEHGAIAIKTEEDDQTVSITITDSGVGIEKERIPNLFNFVENKSTKGTAGETGTGLGLVLTHEFVLKNKGKLNVNSEKGKGTSIQIVLPKAA